MEWEPTVPLARANSAALRRHGAGVIVPAMPGGLLSGSAILLFVSLSCGGSERPVSAPADSEPTLAEEAPTSSAAEPEKAAPEAPAEAAAHTADPAPEFKPNGSVLEAINAVPQGTPRLNIEQEALGRPLGNVELYEACKPGNMHFKAKVAVWDGKAVGLDLTTTPKNQRFADCVAEKIRTITWPDKVKSLNVVEYSY
jgi:hypothetical protein